MASCLNNSKNEQPQWCSFHGGWKHAMMWCAKSPEQDLSSSSTAGWLWPHVLVNLQPQTHHWVKGEKQRWRFIVWYLVHSAIHPPSHNYPLVTGPVHSQAISTPWSSIQPCCHHPLKTIQTHRNLHCPTRFPLPPGSREWVHVWVNALPRGTAPQPIQPSRWSVIKPVISPLQTARTATEPWCSTWVNLLGALWLCLGSCSCWLTPVVWVAALMPGCCTDTREDGLAWCGMCHQIWLLDSPLILYNTFHQCKEHCSFLIFSSILSCASALEKRGLKPLEWLFIL